MVKYLLVLLLFHVPTGDLVQRQEFGVYDDFGDCLARAQVLDGGRPIPWIKIEAYCEERP